MENIEKLRINAENLLKKRMSRSTENSKDLDLDTLLQEIDVYHAELEAQNEELLEREASLKESLYLNQLLYDEAPFSYFYVDEKFNIVSVNHMAQAAFSIKIINEIPNTFYKYIAKGKLRLFMTWVQNDDYKKEPLEIDLVSHNEIKKFRVFIKKFDSLQKHYLISLVDIHKEYLLKKETEENNKILYEIAQYQSNMVVIFDINFNLKFVNKSFLKFYKASDIEDFINKHECICNTFLKRDTFFHGEHSMDNHWVKRMTKIDDSKRAVCIFDENTLENKTFMVNIAKTNLFEHICTFSEITNFSLQKEMFREKSYKDELTKIYNRAKYNEFFEYEFSYFLRDKINLTMILFDIDFFKKINDNYGHDIGDKILVDLTTLVSKYIRKADLFARWGGEEFVVLLKGCTLEKGVAFAENIRKKIQEEIFTNKLKITCSFGIAEAMKNDTIESFTKRVDLSLYKAKESGRNCVRS